MKPSRRFLNLLCPLALLLIAPVSAQHRFETPVERSGFQQLTSYDTLQSFLKSIDGKGRISLRQIATTRQGRSVTCCLVSNSRTFGIDTDKVRVLLFAQQHGDEPSGKEAMTLLLAKFAGGGLDSLLDRADVLIVPQMNPDGAELRQRRTADSLDLNRNHLLLTSPAPKGLHDLFAEWLPDVTLDVHEYGPFSTSWADSGFVKRSEVQLGMLTNLNSPPAICRYQHEKVFPFIASAMRDAGYTFQEYIVGSPEDLIRYSTTEPNDGRQSFGILGTLSFIQEGRGGRVLEDRLERRARSQLTSIEALVRFCASHAGEIRRLVNHERDELTRASGRTVVLCMDHFVGGGRITIPVQLVPSGKDSVWEITRLHDVVRPLASRSLPAAYVVPREREDVKQLLARHHVRMEIVTAGRTVEAEVYLVDSVKADTLEDEWHPKPFLRTELRKVQLRPGDLFIPTGQMHAMFLGIALEPESMWGLVKYPAFQSLLKTGEYPILRIP